MASKKCIWMRSETSAGKFWETHCGQLTAPIAPDDDLMARSTKQFTICPYCSKPIGSKDGSPIASIE